MMNFEKWFNQRLPEGIFSNDQKNMKAAELAFKELLKEAYDAGYDEGATND